MNKSHHIFITGASGNVGSETIRSLMASGIQAGNIVCGVRNITKAKTQLPWKGIAFREFDFEKADLFELAVQGVDIVMLVRPPQITDMDRVMKPFIDSCARAKIKHIVFLSVQGVEQMSFIPHAKIEQLILESGLPYTFIRPAYFMQNFLHDLHKDLVEKRRIFLPAGKAKFNLIDVREIGGVFSRVIQKPQSYRNQSLEITGRKNLTFGEMAEILSQELGEKISYPSPSILRFYVVKRKEGIVRGKVLVMILLHFLPRLSRKEPRITKTSKEILGKEPIEFRQFVKDYREKLFKK